MALVTDWSHTTSWPSDPRSVAGTRRFVRACLTTHRREEVGDDVALVVSELATNAVVHASSTEFSVTLAGRRESLVLTVRDASGSQPDYGRHDLDGLGGRGLRIVDAHCSAWGTSPEVEGGKSVWASFDGGARTSTSRADGEGVGEAVL
jgi:anti-sigma regulatory factor (Ser/Thr protein kinase)